MMASYQLPVPRPMSCKGNTELNWKTFRDEYDDYVTATGLVKKDNTVQVATLRTLMGPECKKMLAGLKVEEDQLKDPAEILKALDEHFVIRHH